MQTSPVCDQVLGWVLNDFGIEWNLSTWMMLPELGGRFENQLSSVQMLL